MSSPRPSVRVQIHHIDYTLSPPGFLDNSSLYRVPIIRIYGPTSLGSKACVHIHQVYPYFLVDYPGNLAPDDGQSRSVMIFLAIYGAPSEYVYS
jgi:DNA polymerase zeta